MTEKREFCEHLKREIDRMHERVITYDRLAEEAPTQVLHDTLYECYRTSTLSRDRMEKKYDEECSGIFRSTLLKDWVKLFVRT